MREIHNLMTIGEVAGSFGVCVATVRRWCKNGKFSRVIRTIGNQRRFDPDEVHETASSYRRQKDHGRICESFKLRPEL